MLLDADLIAFVRRSLRSIWALELLLHLRRASPAALSVQEMARDLRATPHLVRRLAAQLSHEGLIILQDDALASFRAATPELEQLCDMVDWASRERPIALRDAIVSAPNDKLQSLADAFRFKDRKD